VKAIGSLLAAGILLALAGCSDPREKAERTLREVGTPALRQDAAAFYKNLFAAPPARYFLPKANQWPASFQRFKPLRVRAYPDGFAIAVRDQRGMEEGLYIVPLGMDGTPRESRTSHLQKIEDGIYWYRFTD
jgi:hypothetical protein